MILVTTCASLERGGNRSAGAVVPSMSPVDAPEEAPPPLELLPEVPALGILEQEIKIAVVLEYAELHE